MIAGNPFMMPGGPSAAAKQAAAAAATSVGKKGPIRQLIGSVGRWNKKQGISNALATATGAVFVAPMVLDAVVGAGEKFDAFGQEEKLRRAELALAQAQMESASRRKRTQRLVDENLQLLASHAPHAFNELATGMALPQDATVIGGKPREDVLRAVALGMSNGRFRSGEESL